MTSSSIDDEDLRPVRSNQASALLLVRRNARSINAVRRQISPLLETTNFLPLQCTNGDQGAGLKLTAEIITVHPERTFTIARNSADSFEHAVLKVEEDGHVGRGEAAPTSYYGESAEKARAALESVEVKDPWDIEGTLSANSGLPPSALSALDNALHDLAAKRLGVPVYRLLGLARPEPITAYTLGDLRPRDDPGGRPRVLRAPDLQDEGRRPGRRRNRAGRLRSLGSGDLGRRQRGVLGDDAPELVRELKAFGVAMIEQPVPASGGPRPCAAGPKKPTLYP